MSCPIQEYDVFRCAAQKMVNITQKAKTTKERTETSPNNGKFTFFRPQFLHLLLNKQQQNKEQESIKNKLGNLSLMHNINKFQAYLDTRDTIQVCIP